MFHKKEKGNENGSQHGSDGTQSGSDLFLLQEIKVVSPPYSIQEKKYAFLNFVDLTKHPNVT